MAALFLLVAILAGCAGTFHREEELRDADYYYNRGMEQFKKKDYLDAIESFQVVVNSFSNSPIVDEAQFMLGEANFKAEEFLTAAFEYERVYMDYPTSTYAAEAQYKKALSYSQESPRAELDQENTQLAIAEYLRFIDNYPRDKLAEEAQKRINELRDKLAYKEYRNGVLYRKLKHDDAALIYFQYVIEQYPRSVWAEHARLGSAEILYKQGKYNEAAAAASLLVNSDAESSLKDNASKLLDDIATEQANGGG